MLMSLSCLDWLFDHDGIGRVLPIREQGAAVENAAIQQI